MVHEGQQKHKSLYFLISKKRFGLKKMSVYFKLVESIIGTKYIYQSYIGTS